MFSLQQLRTNFFRLYINMYTVQIGVHYDGIFYEFVPWNGVVSWEISQWGYWYLAAENGTHMVILSLAYVFFLLIPIDDNPNLFLLVVFYGFSPSLDLDVFIYFLSG